MDFGARARADSVIGTQTFNHATAFPSGFEHMFSSLQRIEVFTFKDIH